VPQDGAPPAAGAALLGQLAGERLDQVEDGGDLALVSAIGPPGRIWSSFSGTITIWAISSSRGSTGRTRRVDRLRSTASSSAGVRSVRTTTPYRNTVTSPSFPNL
jgi:hypothetical protein